MKNIQAVKAGNVVNVGINGKLHKKNCGSPKEAKEFFKIVLEAKENPTDENIDKIYAYINDMLRIPYMVDGFDTDVQNGNVYLEGFSTPLPKILLEIIKEYHENEYPLTPIVNFWLLLMINPDKRVREDLFDFITTHDFVLTDKGYMVTYKAVYVKEGVNDEDRKFFEFITQQFYKVRKDWKTSPMRYVVYKNLNDNTFSITKKKTAENWDEKTRNVEIFGNLGELYEAIVLAAEKQDMSEVVYTDMHTQKMTIKVGQPVRQARKECDANPRQDCSNGLHVGATKYVEKFANWNNKTKKVILVCLVNPANVVAVPQYDHSKMRVCEYFPFAIADYQDGKIDIIEQKYFEDDYSSFEKEELEKLVEVVRKNELPIETAINAEKEERPMTELMKMIETRMVDIS